MSWPTYEGEPFFSGVYDNADGEIMAVYSYRTAERAGFHHSLYVDPFLLDVLKDGSASFFWVTEDGKIEDWNGSTEWIKELARQIRWPKKRPTMKTEAAEPGKSKVVAVDFDGVVHAYSEGWKDGSIYDEPLPGAIQALQTLAAAGPVFIMTARDNLGDVKAWLEERGITCELIPPGVTMWDKPGVVGITNRKLPADSYVDDRAVRFDSWPSVFAKLSLGESLLEDELEVIGELPRGLYAKPSGGDEYITGAALKIGNKVFVGAYHAMCHLAASYDKEASKHLKPVENEMYSPRCGFMTSTGRFVSRAEAMELAKKRYQISRRGVSPEGLDSMDLKRADESQVFQRSARVYPGL